MANKFTAVWILTLLAACDAAPTYTSPSDGEVQLAADKKVQRVIAQLQADCDSSLQRETYKRVQALLQAKRQKQSP
jgi:hypothetical protein